MSLVGKISFYIQSMMSQRQSEVRGHHTDRCFLSAGFGYDFLSNHDDCTEPPLCVLTVKLSLVIRLWAAVDRFQLFPLLPLPVITGRSPLSRPPRFQDVKIKVLDANLL